VTDLSRYTKELQALISALPQLPDGPEKDRLVQEAEMFPPEKCDHGIDYPMYCAKCAGERGQ
jgi:hypothetical protein